MASFKQKMSNKAVLFAYDHKQISERGKRLGDSYKEVKKTIENKIQRKYQRMSLFLISWILRKCRE